MLRLRISKLLGSGGNLRDIMSKICLGVLVELPAEKI